MITYTTGNILDSDAEALVNTVNTVGVMGKGIALMFKEHFPLNYKLYVEACKSGEVQVGSMFITDTESMHSPKFIINFPTKKHWRSKTQIQWVEEGLTDLVESVINLKISSIAIPPLGCGNGGLNWKDVKPLVDSAFSPLHHVRTLVFEPTTKYQNIQKRSGVSELTPARALMAALIRDYLRENLSCTMLEAQKLAWFLDRSFQIYEVDTPFKSRFIPHKYGPYSDSLRHLLNAMDGSYLYLEKRMGDASAFDEIEFNWEKNDTIDLFLKQHSLTEELRCLNWVYHAIEGFETPFGLELLATVDWIVSQYGASEIELNTVRNAINHWADGGEAARRKMKLFDDHSLKIALHRSTSDIFLGH